MIKYPYLPESKTIKYISIADKYMKEAYLAAKDISSEKRHPTGAIIVKDNKIIGRGGNQVIIKNPTLQKLHNRRFCTRKLFRAKSGEKYWLCPACASPSKHAEQEAVNDALSKKEDTVGSDLYLWGHWWCCEPCWNKMLSAGIDNVFLLDNSEYLFNRDNEGQKIGDFNYFEEEYE